MKLKVITKFDKRINIDGVLYFIQRLEEMLRDDTDHVFRLPVFNTYLLVGEYISTFSLVKEKKIDEVHLRYIMEEFQDSIKKDIIIKANMDVEKIEMILNKLNTSSNDDQIKLMKYVFYLLKDYNIWCKDFIIKIVKEAKEKKKIEMTLKCFVPGLISAGYSPIFIIEFIKEKFYNKNVVSYELFQSFIERFDFKLHDYVVYMGLSNDVLKYKDILKNKLKIQFEIDDDISLKYNKKKYIISKLNIKAYDIYGANVAISSRFNVFLDFHQFLSNKNENWIYEKIEVIDKENNNKTIIKYQQENTNVPLGETFSGNVSFFLIENLLEKAENEYGTIKTALKAHNAALKDSDAKNIFLNLWSVLEILFIRGSEKTKIFEIEENLLPILKRDYIQTLKMDLRNYFLDNLSKKQIEEIRAYLGEEDWVLQLIISKENKEIISKINKKLKKFPLIRTKLSLLLEKFHKIENLSHDVKRYEQRIKWHLKRLYRTRNSIIHAGKSPMALKQLCKHLHCYVDGCLLEIVVRLARQTRLSTIDNAIIDIKLRNEEIETILLQKKQLDKKEIDIIFND